MSDVRCFEEVELSKGDEMRSRKDQANPQVPMDAKTMQAVEIRSSNIQPLFTVAEHIVRSHDPLGVLQHSCRKGMQGHQ